MSVVSRGIIVWSLGIFLAQPVAHAQEEKFGEVNFPISCSPSAQVQFNRAVAMLHSFFFPETVKAFTALTQQEPSCAMAYWGIAISQRPNPLVAPFPPDLMSKGWQAIEAGRAAGTIQADIDKLKEFSASLAKAGDAYWSGQVEVQIFAAQAWLSHGQGNKTEAVKLMRAAADREDNSEKHVAMENRLYPMRELLADLLLEEGDAASALKEYEASMKNAPERLRAFYGAAKAATAVGNKEKTIGYLSSQIGRAHV